MSNNTWNLGYIEGIGDMIDEVEFEYEMASSNKEDPETYQVSTRSDGVKYGFELTEDQIEESLFVVKKSYLRLLEKISDDPDSIPFDYPGLTYLRK